MFGTRRHISRGVWLPREIRVVPPIGIICITIWGIGLWLVLAHSIACSDIKSLIEGEIGQCSSGWLVDWQLMLGLACAGFSVTACTSCSLFPSSSSTFLAKVDIFASSPYPRRVQKCLPFGGLKASFSLLPFDSVHPIP